MVKNKSSFEQQILADAHLGIVFKYGTEIFNPLENIPESLQEQPELYFTWLMSQPEYFYMACKCLFKVKLHPFQGVILKEIWNHKFPMLVASRGASKSYSLAIYGLLRALLLPRRKILICSAGFRQSQIIFNYMVDIIDSSPIMKNLVSIDGNISKQTAGWELRLGSSSIKAIPLGDGCVSADTQILYRDRFGTIRDFVESNQESCDLWVNEHFGKCVAKVNNGIKPVLEIITKKGYRLTATHNHQVTCFSGGKPILKRIDEITTDDSILIDAKYRWHNGSNDVSVDEAYSLGLMIGDGCWTSDRLLRYATKDIELVRALEKGTGYNFTQCGDMVHFNHHGTSDVKKWRDRWGFGLTYTKDKYIPDKMMSATRDVMAACLRGLFDTDGHIQASTMKGGVGITIGFTNTSKKLVEQMQYLLLHYGIIARISNRQRKNTNWNLTYEIHITGRNVLRFYEEIGFGLSYKQEALKDSISKKQRWPSQEKYYEGFYIDSVQSINSRDCQETYDIEVEDTHMYNANGWYIHNSRIRGLRANDILADEFDSIPIDVFETVVAGFAAVSSSPVENAARISRNKVLKELESIEPEQEDNMASNQIILTGTAGYSFRHFAKYHERYCNIIKSRGRKDKLQEVFGDEDPPRGFSWKDFSVIRIPVGLLPEGFLDDSLIARAKATVHNGIFDMEYNAVFSSDSNGFFPRTIIDKCTVQSEQDMSIKGVVIPAEEISFLPKLYGNSDYEYVMGIDPAMSMDNFAIVILEIHNNHRRVVYCWTTNEADYKDKYRNGSTTETNYYSFCIRKIRDLYRDFNIVRIAIDKDGGGRAVLEGMNDEKIMKQGELKLWPVYLSTKVQDTDYHEGPHIIDVVNFSKEEYTSKSNHGMRKDMEERELLFPLFDAISLAEADITQTLYGKNNEEEKVMLEIEELKNELCTIVVTSTAASGRERFDTPEIKIPGGRKGKMHKDRYSALLMANMVARTMAWKENIEIELVEGGFADGVKTRKSDESKNMYTGPSWLAKELSKFYS